MKALLSKNQKLQTEYTPAGSLKRQSLNTLIHTKHEAFSVIWTPQLFNSKLLFYFKTQIGPCADGKNTDMMQRTGGRTVAYHFYHFFFSSYSHLSCKLALGRLVINL